MIPKGARWLSLSKPTPRLTVTNVAIRGCHRLSGPNEGLISRGFYNRIIGRLIWRLTDSFEDVGDGGGPGPTQTLGHGPVGGHLAVEASHLVGPRLAA